jgi:hypothetical protein
MKYTNKEKTDLRKKLKSIGYKCSIRESSIMGRTITTVSMIQPNGVETIISSGNVYSSEYIKEHKQAIDFINEFMKG